MISSKICVDDILRTADESLHPFLKQFCLDRREDILKLNGYLKENNLEEISRMKHLWKGFCDPYGFGVLNQWIDGFSLLIEKNTQDIQALEVAAQTLRSKLKLIEEVLDERL